MSIITFITQKGGSGKTTLVLSCAVAADELGVRVLILDMDPQKTAEPGIKRVNRRRQSWQPSRPPNSRLPSGAAASALT